MLLFNRNRLVEYDLTSCSGITTDLALHRRLANKRDPKGDTNKQITPTNQICNHPLRNRA